MDDPVESWLATCSPNTKTCYTSYFKLFESFIKKSGSEMIVEGRKYAIDPEKIDYYSLRVFEFYRHLLSGRVKAKVMGSVEGRAGGWTGRYKDKPLSQHTARTAVSAVRSFFAFHNLPINLKKFTRKDARMRKPQVEKKKHQLVAGEIHSLFRIADARDKAILALGLMGQDESTVASLRLEQFDGKLACEKLEFIDTLRQKTNEQTKILLTTEVQNILVDYIISIGKHTGWLFQGYKKSHITEQLCNEIFKRLCEQSEIRDNGKRLSFHCCRMWFSTQLRNKVSDDIIDLLTGHEVRFGGAYLADDETKLRQLLTEANVQDLLQLQEGSHNGLSKEVEEQKAKLSEQAKTIESLQEELTAYKADMDALRLKFPLTEEERARAKPFPIQKGAMKIREVKIYEPKKPPVVLDAVLREASPNVHDEIAELRREIEALKKAQKS